MQPSLPTVSEQEVNKYEDIYMKEYEQLKMTRKLPEIRWVQPTNKKEECKMYVSVESNEKDKTQQVDYKLFWDGECKDGYAYGLGREIEQTMLSELHQIGYYAKGKAQDYCVMQDELQGVIVAGECNYDFLKPNHAVGTMIKENMGNLSVEYRYGSKSIDQDLLTIVSPFNDSIVYVKDYSSVFAYRIFDFRKAEFDHRNWQFDLIKNGKENGYGHILYKNRTHVSAEVKNGVLQRRVEIPQNYVTKIDTILKEIQNEGQIALVAQEKALIIKKKYLEKICKNDVKVSFMENDKYKAICYEDEKMAKMKVKIDEKLAKINDEKKQKRIQQNQQKLIEARQMEANAARQQADAADMANFNQSMQNINLNNQLQQLNNNLMMNNLRK